MISSALLTTYSTTKFLKYEAPTSPPPPSATETVSIGLSPSRSIQASRSTTIPMSPLSQIPRPTLLTFYRFAGSLFLGLVVHPNVRFIMHRLRSTLQAVPDFALPATFLFVANLANSISLDRIGISLTYTSKCAIPLITVLLTLLLEGRSALPPPPALLSLVPIAAGIGAASWNSPIFEWTGFVFAMISATAQSALNVSSKRAILKTQLSGLAAQRVMVTVGLALTVALTVGRNLVSRSVAALLWETRTSKSVTRQKQQQQQQQVPPPPAWLSLMAATAYHVEYSLSFILVKLVRPITYGAADAVRRLSIILAGRVLFPGAAPLTRLNVAGIALALVGALLYSITSSSSSSSASN